MSVDQSHAYVMTGVHEKSASTCTNQNDSFVEGAISMSAVA
jgi:hypothetical protein